MRTLTLPAATMFVLALLVPSAWAQPASVSQTVDPDVQHLIELTGASRVGTQMASLVATQILKQLQQQHPDVPPRAVEIVRGTLDEEFQAAFAPDGALLREVGAVWGSHFTHEEIQTLIAFYETPLGRKLVDHTPAIMQECAQAGAAWAQQNIPAISKKIQDRLRAEGLIK
jgi:hypothetical protein